MHGIEYLKKMVKCINCCDIFVCFWALRIATSMLS